LDSFVDCVGAALFKCAMSWEELNTWPYEWLAYGHIGPKEPMERGFHNLVLRRMQKSGELDWALGRPTPNLVTGGLGEAFMYHMLCLKLKKKIKPFKYKGDIFTEMKGFRREEGNEPIDLSFQHDGVWVHVCVKASAVPNRRNLMESSPKFYELTDNFLAKTQPTMIIRCRFNYLDHADPMGPRSQLYIAVYRNY